VNLIAVHEASNATVGAALGFGVTRARIWRAPPHGAWLGYVEYHGRPTRTTFVTTGREFPAHRLAVDAVCKLSGSLGENLFCGVADENPVEWRAYADLIEQISTRDGGRPPTLIAEEIEWITCDALKRNSMVVHRVATQLSRRHTLDRKELGVLLRDVKPC